MRLNSSKEKCLHLLIQVPQILISNVSLSNMFLIFELHITEQQGIMAPSMDKAKYGGESIVKSC